MCNVMDAKGLAKPALGGNVILPPASLTELVQEGD